MGMGARKRKRERVRRQRRHTIEDFILSHAVGLPIAAETDYDKALFFGHDGLVDMPSCFKMR